MAYNRKKKGMFMTIVVLIGIAVVSAFKADLIKGLINKYVPFLSNILNK